MTAALTNIDYRATGRVRRGLACCGITLLLSAGAAEASAQDPESAGVWDLHPEQRWHVSEGLRIGEGGGQGPAALGFAQCVAIDPMDRIWVVEARAHELRVFDADGSFVRAVEKLGEGAGEFQRIGHAFPGPGDEIWVAERSLRRYQVFDTAGTWTGSHRFLFPEAEDEVRAWSRQGLLAVREAFTEAADTIRLYRLADGALSLTDRKAAWPTERVPMQILTVGAAEANLSVSFQEAIPFAARPYSFLGSGLDLWAARQIDDDTYQIRRTDLETGDDLLVITRRYEPVSVPDSRRRAAADSLVELHTSTGNNLLSKIDWRSFPRHYPGFESVHLSASGEVWVRRTLRRTLAGNAVGFDVFAPDGRYLGQPVVPASLGTMNLQVITANSIYAIHTDDAGADYVVRFDVSGDRERRAATGFLTGCPVSG